MRGPGVKSGLPVAFVQRQAESLALLYSDRVPGAGAWLSLRGGPLLGTGVGKEQVVGNVLPARRSLLWQIIGPSEQLEDRPDQVLLGDRFVGVRGTAEGLVPPGNVLPESGERLGVVNRDLPLGCGLYAVGEEVMGKQLAGHAAIPVQIRE